MPTETVAPPGAPPSREGASVADAILEARAESPKTTPIVTDGELGHYANALVAARFRIAIFTLGAMLGAVLLALVLPRHYTARVVMLPSEDGEGAVPGNLSSLANSFGFNLPFGSASQSDLYPAILTSDQLLLALLEDSFHEAKNEPSRKLVEILVPHFDDPHERKMQGLVALRRGIVRAHKDSETGIVSLEITSRSPLMSADVANRLTERLETYLITSRQDQGGGNRAFFDSRLEVVMATLQEAEEALKDFREANRRMQNSPELLLQEDRLRRDVLLQEQIVLELRRQKEIAKIEEVKNTPVLRVLDNATPPIRPSRPHRTMIVVLGTMLGALVAVSYVLVRSTLQLSPRVAAALAPLGEDARSLRRFVQRKATPLSP